MLVYTEISGTTEYQSCTWESSFVQCYDPDTVKASLIAGQ